MTNYKIQLERLKRHYQYSLNHYDRISFLDLAHTLRLWTEIKIGIDQLTHGAIFKKGILTKKIKKIITGSEYTYTYLPGGITTSATATGENNGRIMIHGPSREKFSALTLMNIEKNKDLTISQFLMTYHVLSEEDMKTLDYEIKNIPIEKVSFSKYMESPAIHFQYSNVKSRHISNEDLIKRVANEYEASHASNADTNFDLNNVFSDPVKRLMEYGCVQLPLPYFVLLHISKSIIENLEKQL